MKFVTIVNNFLRRLKRQKKQPTLLIHLHVPKTAGTSINNLLTKHYGGRALTCDNADALSHFMSLPVEERDRNYDAAFGHIVWGWHGYFTREAQYFSSVRNEIDRIASYFNYIHVTESQDHHLVLKKHLVSLDQISQEFLDEHPGLKTAWSNAFCHHYAARHVQTLEEYREVEKRLIEDMKAGRFVCGSLSRIEKFLKMRRILRGTLPRENVTNHKLFQDYEVASQKSLSPKTIKFLREINQFDLRLLDAIADYEAKNPL